jgi:RHS repeat-associated protein
MQNTDEQGNIIQAYTYDPFGGLQDGAKDKLNRYRFVGLAHDDATDLTYMNARWYDPDVGRFTARDKVSPSLRDTQEQVRYHYAHNNPISRSDPTGLLDGPPSEEEQARQQRESKRARGDPRSPEQVEEDERRREEEDATDPVVAQQRRDEVDIERKAKEIYDKCIWDEGGKIAVEEVIVEGKKKALRAAAAAATGPAAVAAAAAEAAYSAWSALHLADLIRAMLQKCSDLKAEYVRSHTRAR